MNTDNLQAFRKQFRVLERKMSVTLSRDTCCCGVTLAQCHTLIGLAEKGVTTLTALTHAVDLDKSTLSRTIEGLVQIGLVERRANPSNRRSIDLALTKQGETTVRHIHQQWNDFFAKLFDRIPPEKHGLVLEGISLLADAIIQSDDRHEEENKPCRC